MTSRRFDTAGRAIARLQRRVDRIEKNRRGYAYVQTIYFTESGAFNKADYPGLRAVKVKVQAGGGAGGGRSSAGGPAAGGGGGGYGETFISASDLSASESVEVGEGGTGISEDDGDPGNNSFFGAHITCVGGGGGAKNGGFDVTVVGGSGGAVTGADFSIPGQAGKSARADSAVGITDSAAGDGGSSFMGAGAYGTPPGQTGTGRNATNYGGGGAGANGSTSQIGDGGDGGDGIVILEIYV